MVAQTEPDAFGPTRPMNGKSREKAAMRPVSLTRKWKVAASSIPLPRRVAPSLKHQ